MSRNVKKNCTIETGKGIKADRGNNINKTLDLLLQQAQHRFEKKVHGSWTKGTFFKNNVVGKSGFQRLDLTSFFAFVLHD